MERTDTLQNTVEEVRRKCPYFEMCRSVYQAQMSAPELWHRLQFARARNLIFDKQFRLLRIEQSMSVSSNISQEVVITAKNRS